jgi:hypothetical protein
MAAEPPDVGFTNREVRLIFERAGKLDGASDRGERRMSLSEIQEIGAQAGLDPDDVAAAAASIRSLPIEERLSGGPARFRVGAQIDKRLGDEGIAALVNAARDATGYHGSVGYHSAGAEWRARSALGAIIVSAEARASGTRIDVVVSREDARALSTIASAVAGVGLGGWVAIFAAHALQVSTATSVVAGAVTAAASGWGIARAVWRPISHQWSERTRELLATLVHTVERNK